MSGGARRYDDIIIGAGMAGLTMGALLARAGRRVLVLEAHDAVGGYAHTFVKGRHRLCAQVHYIFGCSPGQPVHEVLRRLGLTQDVRFVRLDPEGYDHVVAMGERFAIPNASAGFSSVGGHQGRRATPGRPLPEGWLEP